MAETPKGTRKMSDTEVGDSWVDSALVWKKTFYQLLILGVASTATNWLTQSTTIWIFYLVATILLIWKTTSQISEKKEVLEIISLSEGHPWHDSEGTGKASVFVSDSNLEWVKLKTNVRVIVTKDPLLPRWILREEDIEGAIIARWDQKPHENFIPLLNMAQALADAQNRSLDSEDPIEEARAREDVGESLLEREWEDTEPGSTNYKPGALLRSFKNKDEGE